MSLAIGRQLIRKVALAGVSVAAVIALAEAGVRLAGVKAPGFVPFLGEEGPVIPHPTRGYALRPNVCTSIHRAGRTIRFETNSLGFRDRPLEPRTGEYRVLAVGDSFTVGWGLEAEQSWPAKLEERLEDEAGGHSIRVINAGVSGYNLRQIRSTIEESLPLTGARLVVVGLYSSRYWRLDNPYIVWEGGLVLSNRVSRLTAKGSGFTESPFQRPWTKATDAWLGERFIVGAYMFRGAAKRLLRKPSSRTGEPDAEEKLAPFIAELGRLASSTRELGAELVVLLINHQSKDGRFRDKEKEYNRIVSRFCRSQGIAVVVVLPLLAERSNGETVLHLPRNHDWSAVAHCLAAAELARFLHERGIIRGTETFPQKGPS